MPPRNCATSPELLRQLGDRMSRARSRAPTHPGPHSPRSGLAAKVATAGAGLIDRLRDGSGHSRS
ncbi:MAG: hypothetical protein ACRDYD_07345 [Acidimicrobiales bacterium]